MGFGNFEPRGAARFANPQQSTWRNGVKWHVGQRVSKWTCRMMPANSPTHPGAMTSEKTRTQVFGTITGFEATHRNRPSVKWDEQPAPFETPFHFLQEWHSIRKVD